MAEREVKIGVATYMAATSSDKEPVWGFGLFGQSVDVHDSDVERFDRLNGAAATPPVPLPVNPDPEVLADGELIEPPRSGRGSGADAWAEYADNLGLLVPESATRDDIIALVDESK